MNIQKALLTLGSAHGRSGKELKPVGVLIHYVGNPKSTAKNNRDYFESGSGGNHVSAHYIIGLMGEIIQCVPENERAAHAGKSYAAKYNVLSRTNNSRYIGIETCHPDTMGKFSETTYAALLELTTDICKRHGFDPRTQVLRHFDVTGKECPRYYVRNQAEWDKFIDDVTAVLSPVTPAPKPSKVYPMSEANLKLMADLGVINTPEYWRSANIQYLEELLTKAAAPGVLDKRIDNGISDLETALSVLADAGIVNTPNYWHGVAGMIMYTKELLINIASKSRIVLEKIIHAEACGEPFEGIVIVGNVIMNRCKDKGFPNGIYNVVFQPKQFTPITDGAYEKAVPSASVKKAVDEVLAGKDYSQGALFFRTITGATPDCWHETALTKLFDCGGHRFYK